MLKTGLQMQPINQYMLNQLNELVDMTKKYTDIVELWLDGGWEKENYRWPTQEIYNLIKEKGSWMSNWYKLEHRIA
ncbi:Uncharacterised protein [Sphingobacterium multivorum]|uniref:Alpha-L-fucosidase n=1 Tax=Sphingobacterium multivorum TaxID=28454 RepID=A0A2X2IUG4_SPHMU|nr:alpha-L-fucosidase [Sphingobacterium multivorum]SPZ85902.1 Uncharacterised protein [Sphingobacterium multivorum]